MEWKSEKVEVLLCHNMHWWLEVHICGMVEKCIVSINLRPCKHSVCPSSSCVQGSDVQRKNEVWDARFLLQMKRL
jgi:hypothetical protein